MLKEIMTDLTVVSILTLINSFLMVYFVIPKISWVIKSRKLLDKPNNRSSHASSTPSMAGVSFFLTLIMTLFFIQNFDTEDVGLNIVAASTLIFMVGLKDDLVVSTPTAKLTMETIAILFLLFSSCFHVSTLNGFLGIHGIPLILSYIAIILLLLTIINGFNLIDGIDGLASIVAMIIFSVYALIFFVTSFYFYFLLCLSFIGLLLAYLYYNFSAKEKIFMGDTGSLLIGFCIGFCSLKFLAMDPVEFNHFSFSLENKLVVIGAILCVPLFDLFRVICVRLYHKKSLMYPDRNHAHHILIDTGLSHFKATMLMGLFNYLLVILIIWLSSIYNSYIMTLILGVIFILFTALFHILKKRLPQKPLKQSIPFKLK